MELTSMKKNGSILVRFHDDSVSCAWCMGENITNSCLWFWDVFTCLLLAFIANVWQNHLAPQSSSVICLHIWGKSAHWCGRYSRQGTTHNNSSKMCHLSRHANGLVLGVDPKLTQKLYCSAVLRIFLLHHPHFLINPYSALGKGLSYLRK